MADHISALLCLHVRAARGRVRVPHRQTFSAAPEATRGRFNSLRLCELVGGEGISSPGVKALWWRDIGHFYVFVRGSLGGVRYVCTAAHVKDVYMCVRVDSLRVGCAVSPEGCSPCLWGSDSPH